MALARMECSVVVVGDAKIGKTALIRRLTKNEFTEEYVPTSFDKTQATLQVDGRRVDFVLWDTSGSIAYDSVRSLSYADADVFLVCFSVSDPNSLHNVRTKWNAEIRKHRPDAPVVLCGTAADLRDDAVAAMAMARTGRSPVNQEQGLAVCCQVGAVNYVETAACYENDDCNGVREAFDLCALAAMKHARQAPPPAPPTPRDSRVEIISCGSLGPSSSSVASGVSRVLLNTSFGSHKSSASSSTQQQQHRKSNLNLSFSGSEREGGAILEDDVFPPPPVSPRTRRKSQHLRSSMGCLNGVGVQMKTVEFVIDVDAPQPFHTSTALKAPMSQQRPQRPQPQVPQPAQIRPSCLSRRTSFRSQRPLNQPMVPVAVASPKSPLGSAASSSSYDLKSPTSPEVLLDLNPNHHGIHHLRQGSAPSAAVRPSAGKVTFESIKSHGSTGSTGSKTSTTSTASEAEFSASSLSAAAKIAAGNPRVIVEKDPEPVASCFPSSLSKHIMDPTVPDTEDPELLRQLQFVSPKQGVFRPVQGDSAAGAAASMRRKSKDNCSVM